MLLISFQFNFNRISYIYGLKLIHFPGIFLVYVYSGALPSLVFYHSQKCLYLKD